MVVQKIANPSCNFKMFAINAQIPFINPYNYNGLQ